jgi:hypothetical protein
MVGQEERSVAWHSLVGERNVAGCTNSRVLRSLAIDLFRFGLVCGQAIMDDHSKSGCVIVPIFFKFILKR